MDADQLHAFIAAISQEVSTLNTSFDFYVHPNHPACYANLVQHIPSQRENTCHDDEPSILCTFHQPP
jgi:hypothetical protein